MQTWHIRLVSDQGRPLTFRRAAARYMVACAWVAPASVVAWAAGWSRWEALAAVAVGVVGYGLLALLHPQRQFLHDAVLAPA